MTSQNDYFINQEKMEEMKRLNAQAYVFLHEMGLLAEKPDCAGIQTALDIACGSGVWTLELAQQHPDIAVIGIDKSKRMVHFARAQAEDLKLSNATYQLADATEPLPFENASFDLINMQLIYGFMHNDLWSKLFASCLDKLRPGGLIRVIQEDLQFNANSHALQEFALKLTGALYRNGQAFSPSYLGVIPRLTPLLKQAGFQQVEKKMYFIDYSFGTLNHDALAYDIKWGMKNALPFIVHHGVSTADALERIINQALLDVHEPTFDGFWTLASVSGSKR